MTSRWIILEFCQDRIREKIENIYLIFSEATPSEPMNYHITNQIEFDNPIFPPPLYSFMPELLSELFQNSNYKDMDRKYQTRQNILTIDRRITTGDGKALII